MIALSEPKFQENEKNISSNVLKTNWVSTSGPFVKKFENIDKKEKLSTLLLVSLQQVDLYL